MEPARTLPPELRRKVIRYPLLFASLMCGIFWLLAGVQWLFGIDLLQRLRSREPHSLTLNVGIAALVTGCCVPWAIYRIRQSLFLAEYGLEVVGTVTSLSPLNRDGLIPVRYSYTVGSMSYSGAHDLVKDAENPIAAGDPIRILADPRSPQRSMPFDEVIPSG